MCHSSCGSFTSNEGCGSRRCCGGGSASTRSWRRRSRPATNSTVRTPDLTPWWYSVSRSGDQLDIAALISAIVASHGPGDPCHRALAGVPPTAVSSARLQSAGSMLPQWSIQWASAWSRQPDLEGRPAGGGAEAGCHCGLTAIESNVLRSVPVQVLDVWIGAEQKHQLNNLEVAAGGSCHQCGETIPLSVHGWFGLAERSSSGWATSRWPPWAAAGL